VAPLRGIGARRVRVFDEFDLGYQTLVARGVDLIRDRCA